MTQTQLCEIKPFSGFHPPSDELADLDPGNFHRDWVGIIIDEVMEQILFTGELEVCQLARMLVVVRQRYLDLLCPDGHTKHETGIRRKKPRTTRACIDCGGPCHGTRCDTCHRATVKRKGPKDRRKNRCLGCGRPSVGERCRSCYKANQPPKTHPCLECGKPTQGKRCRRCHTSTQTYQIKYRCQDCSCMITDPNGKRCHDCHRKHKRQKRA